MQYGLEAANEGTRRMQSITIKTVKDICVCGRGRGRGVVGKPEWGQHYWKISAQDTYLIIKLCTGSGF